MFLFFFTLLFSGGLIPTYLVVKELGMLNTRWAMILPTALSVYNMIITRTFFQTAIPDELLEAAKLDGANDFRFLRDVVCRSPARSSPSMPSSTRWPSGTSTSTR